MTDRGEIKATPEEIAKVRASGEKALIKIFEDKYRAPNTGGEADAWLARIEKEREELAQAPEEKVNAEQREELEAIFEAAEFELRRQGGELNVILPHVGGLKEEVEDELGNLQLKDSLGVPREGRYQIGEKEVNEWEAREAAAEEVLKKRLAAVQKRIEAIDPGERTLSVEEFEQLPPEDQGEYHALQVIKKVLLPYEVAELAGADKRIGDEIKALRKQQEKLEGLDSGRAQIVLDQAKGRLPDPAHVQELAKSGAVEVLGKSATSKDRQQTSYLMRTVASQVERVEKTIAGRVPTKSTLTLDLKTAAEERIEEAVWRCAEYQVEAWELERGRRAGGLAGLTEEMAKRNMPLGLLREPFRKHGQLAVLEIARETDRIYRQTFLGQLAPTTGLDRLNPQFMAGLDAKKIQELVLIVVGEGNERKARERLLHIKEGRDLRESRDLIDRFWERVENDGGSLLSERLRKTRLLFGIDKPDTDFSQVLGIAGCYDYISWAMTKRGEYRDSRGRPISWVEGDAIRIEDLGWTTNDFWEYLGAVATHRSAAQALGIDSNPIIDLVLLKDEAIRANVDLERYYQDIRPGGSLCSSAEIKMIAENTCQGLRANLKEVVAEALVSLAPVLTKEGELDPVLVYVKTGTKPWGAQEANWEELAKAEKIIFKHLRGDLKGETVALFYEIAYESTYADLVTTQIGQAKMDILAHVYGLVNNSATRFLRYKTLKQLGLDFTLTSLKNISEFLQRGPEGWKLIASDVGRYFSRKEGKVFLSDLPEEVRLAILMNLGIDVNQPLPERSYQNWLKNLDYLIENWRKLGYNKEILAALKRLKERDPVAEFIGRLREASVEKWKSYLDSAKSKHGGQIPVGVLEKYRSQWQGEGLIDSLSPEEQGLTEGGAVLPLLLRPLDWFPRLSRWLWTTGDIQTARGLRLPIFNLPVGSWLTAIVRPRPRMIFPWILESAVLRVFGRAILPLAPEWIANFYGVRHVAFWASRFFSQYGVLGSLVEGIAIPVGVAYIHATLLLMAADGLLYALRRWGGAFPVEEGEIPPGYRPPPVQR